MKSLLTVLSVIFFFCGQALAQDQPKDIQMQIFQGAKVLGSNTTSDEKNNGLLGARDLIIGFEKSQRDLGPISLWQKGKGSPKSRGIADASALYERNSKAVVLLIRPDQSVLGAGCLMSSAGQILTNAHVVEGCEQMLVFFYDKSVTKISDITLDKCLVANVLASDPNRDLALLKIAAPIQTPFLKFASNGSIRTAAEVFAIGHPEAHIWSFTTGVISQLRNSYEWSTQSSEVHRANVIQTQTPINPGNSGGPLFNDNGELIGINTFGWTAAQNLNFAIRIDEIGNFVGESNSGMHKLTAAAAKPAPKELKWVKLDLNQNGVVDAYATDSRGGTEYDIVQVDKNEDGVVDYIACDSNHDGKPDIYIYDQNNDGAFEYFKIDSDFDGVFETIGIDTNGDGKPDKFSKAQ